MFPLPAFFYIEITALITSVICFPKLKDKPLRWFIPFLALTVLVELSGYYIRKELHQRNSWLYNFYIPLEYCFYLFIVSRYFNTPFFRKCSLAILYLLPLFSICNFYFKGLKDLHTNFLIAASGITIVFCILYFIEILNSDELISPLRQPMFWITTGLFFFNIGGFIYNLSLNYLITHQKDPKAQLFLSIHSKLIFILYSCYIIAFLCTKKTGGKLKS